MGGCGRRTHLAGPLRRSLSGPTHRGVEPRCPRPEDRGQGTGRGSELNLTHESRMKWSLYPRPGQATEGTHACGLQSFQLSTGVEEVGLGCRREGGAARVCSGACCTSGLCTGVIWAGGAGGAPKPADPPRPSHSTSVSASRLSCAKFRSRCRSPKSRVAWGPGERFWGGPLSFPLGFSNNWSFCFTALRRINSFLFLRVASLSFLASLT